MASKLGDFYVELGALPNIQGINSFGNSLNSLKVIAAGVMAALQFKDIAKTAADITEISRSARDLNVSAQNLDKFQKIFQLLGLSAKDANSTIDVLNKTVQGFQFGEYKEELGKLFQLAPQDFTGKFEHDMNLIRDRLRLFPKESWAYRISQIGLGSGLRLFQLDDKEYSRLTGIVKDIGLLTDDEITKSKALNEEIIKLKLNWQAFKREVYSTVMPDMTKLTKGFIDILKDPKIKKISADFLKSMPQTLMGLTGIGLTKKEMLAQQKEVQNFTFTDMIQNYIKAFSGLKKFLPSQKVIEAKEKGIIEKVNTFTARQLFSIESPDVKAKGFNAYLKGYNAMADNNYSDNSIYAPQITVNVVSPSDPKQIGDVVEKKLREHHKQVNQNLKQG